MKKWKWLAAVAIMTIIMFQPESAVTAAQNSMRMWVSGVAPALFPFLVLMPALTGREACMAYRALFSSAMGKLFHLSGEAAPAVIIGMLSGSPGGAISIMHIAGESGMRRGEVWRIALAVTGISPAYLVMGVGQGLYGSAALGVRLAVIQFCVQLAMLFILRGFFKEENQIVLPAAHATPADPMHGAVENVLSIAGYMVFFSVLATALSSLIEEKAGGLLLPIMDLPSGLSNLAAHDAEPFQLGAAIGFGGLCIGMQNMDRLRESGLPWSCYIASRCISASAIALACQCLLSKKQSKTAFHIWNSLNSCAFSTLISAVFSLFLLIYFSKKCVLNNKKSPRSTI